MTGLRSLSHPRVMTLYVGRPGLRFLSFEDLIFIIPATMLACGLLQPASQFVEAVRCP